VLGNPRSETIVATKKRILVVDDEQINLEFFDVMLSNLGFEVHKAENGQEALESIRKIQPDLVILDNIMPKLSGWEVTKIIKSSPEYAEFSDTPIIIFSALDDIKDKVEGLELGADDYITKPFNFAEVLARIHAVLRSHDLLRQIENREKRLVIGDRTVEELFSSADAMKKALEDIAAADDIETTRRLAKKAADSLESLKVRIESLKAESEGLRKESLDIATMRRKTRADIR
jgi:DNA-binding response OmpR family regulator